MMMQCLLLPEWWAKFLEVWKVIEDGVYVLVGAILGVLSSLFLSWCAKKYGIRRLKKMLNLEVDSIIAAVNDIVAGKNKEIKANDAIDFPSPLWSLIGQTSTLLDLSVKDYKKVVKIYIEIKKFREDERHIGNRIKEKRTAFTETLLENKL